MGDKGYTWLQNELRQVGVEYTKEQLRHKWDWMKDQWKMWKALKGSETGLGWDPIKDTVVAPDEWWNKKIKTTTYAIDIICSYYLSYIHKEPCMDSFHTGLVWLQEIMRGNERRCVNLFRMDKDTLIKLCLDLELHYKLKCSKKMTILEKDCIGAIDGTHMSAYVQEENLIQFIGRKGVPTQNIMAAYSFDMQFTFVMAGWEGKYYVVDAGYQQMERYLAPYKGKMEDIANNVSLFILCTKRHSSCVNDILHNYIRRKALADPAFEKLDKSPKFIPPDIFRDADDIQVEESSQESGALQINALRDQIAYNLILANNDY
ncbi:hypothetical protein GH714_022402 [Hevea brasiliensis]|uniref:Uncharacterized protein n=1 Tax=Hevea brasiliensis TaxID=3981 RepID=A0A6A6M5F7_HEVBR|nr:hypothetical protein GH714_022402 [Hevea brasiliensis]